MLWSSVRNQTGRLSFFNESREKYDAGAYLNSFYNIIPYIGSESHQTISRTKSEAIDRGIDRVVYDPSYETMPRKSYVVAIDVWNFDQYWINFIMATIFLSTAGFILSFYNNYKIIEKAKREAAEESVSESSQYSFRNPNERFVYFMKVYGRVSLEFIDTAKDIFWCAATPRENHVLTYFIWIFALLALLFSIFKILIMRKSTYIDEFGDEEFKGVKKNKIKFFYLKIKRVFKEVFYMQQHRNEIEIKARVARQMAFMAMFKNFPMFFM